MEKLKDKPFVLLGVNSDEDREKIKETIAQEKISWRSWWDQSPTGPIQTTWQVERRPAIHLIDGDGVIRYKNIEASELDGAIDRLLEEHDAPPQPPAPGPVPGV